MLVQIMKKFEVESRERILRHLWGHGQKQMKIEATSVLVKDSDLLLLVAAAAFCCFCFINSVGGNIILFVSDCGYFLILDIFPCSWE